MHYSIFVYIFFGILPSLVWLLYYLTKDRAKPEPKKMIVKIFIWGAMITVPVFFVQIGLKNILDQLQISELAYQIIYWFAVIAFTEELFKFLVVKMRVVDSPHLDEPIDIMLYMVVVALGFAAVENILYLFTPSDPITFSELINRTIFIDVIRFVGATFLHTLCSAVVGYSLAVSFCEVKFRRFAAAAGIIIATLLHGLYDFSIMNMTTGAAVIPVIIILTLAFLVFSGFEQLKKMKSICKLR